MENLEHKIELLAKGKLSSTEANQMLEKSNADLNLKSNIAYEKYITKAVGEHRILALKARLQAIPMAPIAQTTFGNLSSNSILALKSAAVVVASLGIGASVYFYNQNSSTVKVENITNVVAANETNETEIAIENTIQTEAPISKENAVIESITTPIENKIIANKSNAKIVQKSSKIQKNVPNMLAFEDASQAEINADMDDSPLESPLETQIHKITTIDIKNITDGKYNFHYLLKENILTLYGNFDASPYEIIERNDRATTNLYLYYNKNYYFLQNTDSAIHKLKKLDDKEIISDLSDSRVER